MAKSKIKKSGSYKKKSTEPNWERWEKIYRILNTIFWVLFLIGVMALFSGVIRVLNDPSQITNSLFIIGVSMVIIQQLIMWFWKGANEIISLWVRDYGIRRYSKC